ncbi:pseudouridine synthase [uncultured Paracoccus sp.]|uniref:pseudouridine synthase n=1 Tax=uncultured Paracoccus sp. TaxID=189685 RepID=UPI002606D1EA|nr:pseudouridine synthase [uncultured Paracoccus sp.]
MTDDHTPDTNSEKPADVDRIAKVIARAGVASRRDAERIILEGRVTVNGEKITSPALDVRPTDRITVDGKPLDAPQETRLWMYYKPVGLVTSEADEKGRQTIFDALPRDLPRVMTVGRLDLNSEGLLLLTNDGELKRRLELPATGWLRRYRVRVNGTPTDLTFDPLRRGVTIDGEDFQPMEVRLDSQQGANAWLTVGIREGRNREIRRAMTHIGLQVNRLIRIGYGPFKLTGMEENEVREVKRKVLRDQLGGLLTGETEDEKPRDFRSRGAESGPRRSAADGEHKPRFGKPDGERKPFGRNDDRGERRDGGKPFARREDGDRKPWAKREDGDRKPFARREDGDRKPWAKREDGDRKPFARREDGDRKPFARREDGDRKPWAKREEGDRKPFARREDGDRKPWAKREDGDRKPWAKREEGDRKPFARREDGDKKPWVKRDRSDDGFKPRGEGGFKPRGEGGFKSRGEGGFKPRGEGDFKPRGEGFKPRGEGGFKPRGDGFNSGGPRKGGFSGGPAGGKGRPAAGKGPRPGGGKPGGGRPGGGKPRAPRG